MAWSQEQLKNVQVIAQVGREVGASARDIQIAIMAAIVESGLRNLDYGDRDSVGMFQQRDAWGSHADRVNPYKSARMFFLGGAAGQRGLLDFSDRNSMGMGEAAQAVQVSAFPDRYAEHTAEAAQLLEGAGVSNGYGSAPDVEAPTVEPDALAQVADLDGLTTKALKSVDMPEAPTVTEVNGLGEITADEAGIGALSFDGAANENLDALTFDRAMQPKYDPMANVKMPSLEDLGVPTSTTTTTVEGQSPEAIAGAAEEAAEGWRKAIVASARKMLGTPYVWGGTSYSGVDCSGLIALLYGKQGFSLPRLSADQARSGKRIELSAGRPGDLVAIDNSSRNVGADHIGILIGNGLVIHAPRPGSVVEIANANDVFGGGWAVSMSRG